MPTIHASPPGASTHHITSNTLDAPGELPLDTTDPQRIAAHLLSVLTTPGLTDQGRDLALARCIRARDYDTSPAVGRVRNVLRVGDAFAAGLLSLEPIELREDLLNLLAGRHYLALATEGPRLRLLLPAREGFAGKIHLWDADFGQYELACHALPDLFASPAERIILGPHVRYQPRPRRAGPLYHEIQSGMDCGLHAINALAGRQVIGKADFQQWLIGAMLEAYQGGGLDEEDFYLNQPRQAELGAFYEFDNGIQPDTLLQLMREHLPGEVRASPFGANRDTLIDLTKDWQKRMSGIIVLSGRHYVALRQEFNPLHRQMEWLLIDSTNERQQIMTPVQLLARQNRLDACMLLGICPPRTHRCVVQ